MPLPAGIKSVEELPVEDLAIPTRDGGSIPARLVAAHVRRLPADRHRLQPGLDLLAERSVSGDASGAIFSCLSSL